MKRSAREYTTRLSKATRKPAYTKGPIRLTPIPLALDRHHGSELVTRVLLLLIGGEQAEQLSLATSFVLTQSMTKSIKSTQLILVKPT